MSTLHSSPKIHNHLINEKSPYLLRNAHSLVSWYPWKDTAFSKAAAENKPIFVCIGYTTCSLCQLMEEECFSRPEIAQILNEKFISIMVDRFERPDIDRVYRCAAQALHEEMKSWPLTIFLTPDKVPFFAGSYFPAKDHWGTPGFKSVLLSLANTWEHNREEVNSTCSLVLGHIRQGLKDCCNPDKSLGEEVFESSCKHFIGQHDSEFGGFGSSPKFPHPTAISFLIHYWARVEHYRAFEIAQTTLLKMVQGGIFDHVGGGFFRYTVDSAWRLPSFEKTLYDQAILSRVYLEAFQATGRDVYQRTAKDTFTYVLRDLRGPEGGFYAAQGGSGNLVPGELITLSDFYLWNKDEISKLLEPEAIEVFCYTFGVENKGNLKLDSGAVVAEGKNILFRAHTLAESSQCFLKSPEEITRILEESRKRLLTAQQQRVQPYRDDMVLTDANGLMIASLAFSYRIFKEEGFKEAAEKAVDFILRHLLSPEGGLWHRFREGKTEIDGFLDDYAFFVWGLVDLYEATFQIHYLQKAVQLTKKMLELFWDEKEGGFFFIPKHAVSLLFPIKEARDDSSPSGNAAAVWNLLRLGRLLGNSEWVQMSKQAIHAFNNCLLTDPIGYAQMLSAWELFLSPPQVMVVVDPADPAGLDKVLDFIFRRFLPHRIATYYPLTASCEEIREVIPYLKEPKALEDKVTVYMCENQQLKHPANTIMQLERNLRRKASG